VSALLRRLSQAQFARLKDYMQQVTCVYFASKDRPLLYGQDANDRRFVIVWEEWVRLDDDDRLLALLHNACGLVANDPVTEGVLTTLRFEAMNSDECLKQSDLAAVQRRSSGMHPYWAKYQLDRQSRKAGV
jgi:hypothetical protein